MLETRTKKHERYRKQIAKRVEEDEVKENKPSTRFLHTSSKINTTSALPLDEIVKQEKLLSEEEVQLKKQEIKRKIKYTLIILGIILAAALIILTGILLF